MNGKGRIVMGNVVDKCKEGRNKSEIDKKKTEKNPYTSRTPSLSDFCSTLMDPLFVDLRSFQ
jgi:hypothetical protein